MIQWALWIVLDLVNVVREFQPVLATVRQQSGTSTSSKSNTSTATATTLADARGKLDDLKLRLIALATDLPLAVHWSLASYPMPEMWVGVLGLVSTVAGSTLKWKYTR